MNAPEQLSMFEPTGDEVPLLVVRSVRAGESCQRLAEMLELQGFESAAAGYRRAAAEHFENAACMEMLVAFERLGGIS